MAEANPHQNCVTSSQYLEHPFYNLLYHYYSELFFRLEQSLLLVKVIGLYIEINIWIKLLT